jgi:hypothetical protein
MLKYKFIIFSILFSNPILNNLYALFLFFVNCISLQITHNNLKLDVVLFQVIHIYLIYFQVF